MLTSITPFVVYFALQWDVAHLGLAVMALVLTMAMLVSAHIVHQQFIQSVRTRFASSLATNLAVLSAAHKLLSMVPALASGPGRRGSNDSSPCRRPRMRFASYRMTRTDSRFRVSGRVAASEPSL